MTDNEVQAIFESYDDRFGSLFGDNEVPPQWHFDPRFWDLLRDAIRTGTPLSLERAESVLGKREWEGVLPP